MIDDPVYHIDDVYLDHLIHHMLQLLNEMFRQLALKYHPDKNKDPKAEETFRSIAEAYDVLGDPAKRRQYDSQGHQFFSSSNQDSFSGFHFDMNDFFKQFDAASSQFHHSQHQAHHDAHYQSHQKAHQKAHQQAHQNHFNFDFNSLFDDDEGIEMDFNNLDIHHHDFGHLFPEFDSGNVHTHTSSFSKTTQQNCRTVTRREGNRVSTITECN